MINRKRFELALERIQPTEWARFEQFASAFLTAEFPELRTVANSSGDGGRDAELFSPSDEPEIMIQYSTADKWIPKIQATAKRLQSTFPDTRQLIYVTNQVIGAKADPIKKTVRKNFGVALDVRDRSYFLDRFEGDDHLEAVAENLAKEIVDPYLQSHEMLERKAQALSPGESRAALVFLELQWEDDSRDKGLTKTAFDALVRTALRSTNSNALLKREEVHKAVILLLPNRDKDSVVRETDKALARLTKHFIRYHPPPKGSFCLTHDEALRIKNRLADTEIQDGAFAHEIQIIVELVFTSDVTKSPISHQDLCKIARTCIEKFLLQRGELFVAALDVGQLGKLGFDTVNSIVLGVLKDSAFAVSPAFSEQISSVVEQVLSAPGAAVSKHLRDLADAYTLLAFLRETPDIQSAVKKMFSVGEIWLDTSIILPLLAEDLVAEEKWQFRRLIATAKNAGLKIKVSPGVIEEIVSHTNNCMMCSSSADWRGNVPYLFGFYISTGKSASNFALWLKRFLGEALPDQDIADYLLRFHGIISADIAMDAAKADRSLRHAVQEAWTTIHTTRRSRYGYEIDPMLSARLAQHDTDNYTGVITRRKQEGPSAFGFTSWWLTLDHMAFSIGEKIKSSLDGKVPPSPVMSADFLSNYLSFGPLRAKAAKTSEALPIRLDAPAPEMTPELLEIAKRVRERAQGMDEHVIEREVRDALDAAKRRTGVVTQNGLQFSHKE